MILSGSLFADPGKVRGCNEQGDETGRVASFWTHAGPLVFVTSRIGRRLFLREDDMPYAITPNPASVNEGAGTLTFTITRTVSFPAETIFASTLNGATNGYATNSGDYATNVNNLPVVFAAGQTSATVTFSITNDTVVESGGTFRLRSFSAIQPTR